MTSNMLFATESVRLSRIRPPLVTTQSNVRQPASTSRILAPLHVPQRRVLDRRREQGPDRLREDPYRLHFEGAAPTAACAPRAGRERLALRSGRARPASPTTRRSTWSTYISRNAPRTSARYSDVWMYPIVVGERLDDSWTSGASGPTSKTTPVDRDLNRLTLRQAVERQVPAACPRRDDGKARQRMPSTRSPSTTYFVQE